MLLPETFQVLRNSWWRKAGLSYVLGDMGSSGSGSWEPQERVVTCSGPRGGPEKWGGRGGSACLMRPQGLGHHAL